MFEGGIAILENWPAGLAGGLAIIVTVGLFTGILSSAMGVGGGFIFTPFFHGVAGLGGVEAVATSTGQIPFSSLSALWRYYKSKKIKYSLAGYLLLGAIPVSQASAWLLGGIKNTSWGNKIIFSQMSVADFMITLLFSTMLISLGIYGLFQVQKKQKKPPVPENTLATKNTKLMSLLAGSGIGFLSAFLGVGGGFIAVPFFIHKAKILPAEAAATSHFCIVPVTAITAIHYWLAGSLFPLLSLAAAAGGIIGAQIGARFAIKTRPLQLEKMFAAMQLFIAFVYLTIKLKGVL